VSALDALRDGPVVEPGGCTDCNAIQELREVEPGVLLLEIQHDATCPTYMAIVARRGGAA